MGSVLEIEFVGSQRMKRIKLNQKKLNQQQDHDLGHKLNMAESETKLCKG
jgi:hypothetical protein